jgi:hypothetical protein
MMTRLEVKEFGDMPFASPVHWAAFTCNGLGYRMQAGAATERTRAELSTWIGVEW